MVESPRSDDIVNATARHFGIPKTEILNPNNKTRDVVYARRVAMYLTRQLTYQSFQCVGQSLGFTHQCIAIACAKIEKVRHSENTKNDISKITKGLS